MLIFKWEQHGFFVRKQSYTWSVQGCLNLEPISGLILSHTFLSIEIENVFFTSGHCLQTLTPGSPSCTFMASGVLFRPSDSVCGCNGTSVGSSYIASVGSSYICWNGTSVGCSFTGCEVSASVVHQFHKLINLPTYLDAWNDWKWCYIWPLHFQVSYGQQGCIYLIKNTKHTVQLWNIIPI